MLLRDSTEDAPNGVKLMIGGKTGMSLLPSNMSIGKLHGTTLPFITS